MTGGASAGPSSPVRAAAETEWLRPALVATYVDTVGVLPIFLTGVLAIQLNEDIGLGISSLGFVYASYFLSAGLFSAPLGAWSEQTGPERALRLGLVAYLVSFAGIALTVHSVPVLIFYMLLSGVGTALTRSASSVLVSRRVAPGRQGLAFGMKHSSIPIASLLSGLAVPLIALTVGWRWAFVAAAVLTLVVLFTVPRSKVRAPTTRSRDARQADVARSTLVLAAFALALGSAAAASLGTYTVTSAVSTGMAEADAGVLVAVGSVVGLVSRIAVGHWSDHRPGDQLDLVVWMLLLGGGAFVLFGLADSAWLWFAVPLTFSTGWAWLGSYNLAMVRLNPEAPGAAVGITQTGAFLGAVAGPVGLGLVADHGSFLAAWSVAGGLCFASAALIWLFQWRLVKDEQAASRPEVTETEET